ncbi:MAG: WD40 repeat domain-containing protein, partial [Planctomycetota bacterium]
LYELLTRERPFRGKDYQDTLSRIIERDPRPPGQLNPRIPTNLETIVLKCLRKEPADRYGTAEALGQDLSRFARGDAIEARPEAPWERLSRRAWRHRAALTSAVLALMLGLLGLSVSNVLIARARDQARRDLYVAHMGLAHETWEASNMGRFKSLLEAQRPEDGQLDRRGWEWYYLHGLLRPEHLTIEAHSDRVRSVAWSPDGGLLASAGGEGTVKLWNAATGKEVRTLKESSAGVISVAWDSRGERLAAGDAAGRVDIWTAATGEKTFSVLAHPNPDPEGHPGGGAISLAWSPDGRYLASGGSDRVGVKVWDVAAGATVFEVPESEWVWSVTWRPDGRQLAAAVNSEKVIVWDAATWQEVGAWQESRYSIYSLAWSPDGRELGWNAKGRINIREQETGIERLRLGAPGEAAYSFVWSPAGDRLAGAGQDGVVRVWDTTTGEALQNLRGHAGRVWSVSWSPDGQYLASGSFDGTIKVWDTAIDPDDMLVASRSGCAAWSPDGEYLALPGPANGPDQVRILDVESLEERHTFPLGPRSAAVRAVAWSPGSRRVASRHQPGTVSVWSLDSGGQLWRVPDPEPGGEVRGKLAWSPDGRHLASTNSTSVKIWNAATGELMRVLTGHTAQLGSLAWSPDGQHLATASWHQAIKIWDTSTWKELQHLQRHPFSSHGSDGQHAVAWSPDGDRLAAGGCEGALIIWETATWSELHRIQGHPVNVRAVSWSSDGLRIATGSSDRTVKIWEAETGQELLTLRGHVHPVRSVEWSPDSERLVTADSRTVRIWDAPGYVEGELTESEH